MTNENFPDTDTQTQTQTQTHAQAEPSSPETAPALTRAQQLIARLRQRVNSELIGQEAVVDQVIIALLSNGHVLLEGVPGLGKTLLVRLLANCFDGDFKRIQFTPDLMPADITGHVLFDMKDSHFRLRKGPVFTNLLLTDEINRAPAKTQAALLEVMQERQVTLEGKAQQLPKPFMVLATQNPIEQEGTYPLPEAQLDRFLFQVNVDYPSADEEKEIVRRTTAPLDASPEPVLEREAILELQTLIPRIPVADHVLSYAVSLARATRPDSEGASPEIRSYLSYGAGPRASQALILGAKARAALEGRFAAETEDVRALALPILRHRLVRNFRADADGVSVETLVDEAVRSAAP